MKSIATAVVLTIAAFVSSSSGASKYATAAYSSMNITSYTSVSSHSSWRPITLPVTVTGEGFGSNTQKPTEIATSSNHPRGLQIDGEDDDTGEIPFDTIPFRNSTDPIDDSDSEPEDPDDHEDPPVDEDVDDEGDPTEEAWLNAEQYMTDDGDGEMALVESEDGAKPLPIMFGFHGLVQLFKFLPAHTFGQPRLKEKGHPVVEAQPWNFTKTVCTGFHVDVEDTRVAQRNLEYFCNRWAINDHRLYAATSGMTSIYMCNWGSEARNCTLGLWKAANDHLDRTCGIGGTGWTYRDKLQMGRSRPALDDVICENLRWSPLWMYRIDQSADFVVDGRPYAEWHAREKIRKGKLVDQPKDINEGNDADP